MLVRSWPRCVVIAIASAVALVAGTCLRAAEGELSVQEKALPEASTPPPMPVILEARCSDGSLVKLKLLDERLRLKTRYGELQIPANEIERIDFATRVPEATAKRIREAVQKLASTEFEIREAAGAELLSYEERAYQALVEAQKHEDPEVVFRAEQLLEKLREAIPEERLAVRPRDVIYADGSTIAGMLLTDALRVETTQFGEQQLKVSDLNSLRAPGTTDAEAGAALPDPGNLSQFQGQIGKTLIFRVGPGAAGMFGGGPGLVNGAVWGTDVYTLDSSLASAAVHAGALRAGQTGIVRVEILGPQGNFQGSMRNGVSSSPWGQFPGAFKFKR